MSSTSPDPYLGRQIDGRYTLRRALGQGGMGAVYVAKDDASSAEVALKLLRPSEAKTPQLAEQMQLRMKREIKVLLLVEDARVIQLDDWGNDPDFGFYYTMELLPKSQTLAQYVEEHEPGLRSRLELLREILFGLAALHEVHAVHRDLKPDNVLLVAGVQPPAVKIIDPGIAKWYDTNLKETLTLETEAGKILGTPLYMAPEMWMGQAVDPRTDIYQMGIIGYELLTGSRPYVGNFYNVMMHHLQADLPSMVPLLQQRYPEISEALAAHVDATMRIAASREPGQRFLDSKGFAAAIGLLLEACEASDPKKQLETLPYHELAPQAALFAPGASSLMLQPLPSGTSLLASPQGSSAQLPATPPQAEATAPPRQVWGLLALLGAALLAGGLWLWLPSATQPQPTARATGAPSPPRRPAAQKATPTPPRLAPEGRRTAPAPPAPARPRAPQKRPRATPPKAKKNRRSRPKRRQNKPHNRPLLIDKLPQPGDVPLH